MAGEPATGCCRCPRLRRSRSSSRSTRPRRRKRCLPRMVTSHGSTCEAIIHRRCAVAASRPTRQPGLVPFAITMSVPTASTAPASGGSCQRWAPVARSRATAAGGGPGGSVALGVRRRVATQIAERPPGDDNMPSKSDCVSPPHGSRLACSTRCDQCPRPRPRSSTQACLQSYVPATTIKPPPTRGVDTLAIGNDVRHRR